MRNIFSIVFIALLLMNVMGYYGVFLGLQFRNDAQMVKLLDREKFTKEQFINIKIPLSIPYAFNEIEYQRVDGKFMHEGEVYRLLKQKHSGDTLFLVCVRDTEAKLINDALTSYVKTFSENSATHSSTGKLVVSLIKDYLPEAFEVQSSSLSWSMEISNTLHTKVFISSFIADVVHPPERA